MRWHGTKSSSMALSVAIINRAAARVGWTKTLHPLQLRHGFWCREPGVLLTSLFLRPHIINEPRGPGAPLVRSWCTVSTGSVCTGMNASHWLRLSQFFVCLRKEKKREFYCYYCCCCCCCSASALLCSIVVPDLSTIYILCGDSTALGHDRESRQIV